MFLERSPGMRKALLAVFLVMLLFKLWISFSYFSAMPADDVIWYLLGDQTLRNYGMEDPLSSETSALYQAYYNGETMSIVSYLPVLWYFMAFLVKASGSSYVSFVAIYLALLNLADVVIFYLMYRILGMKGVSGRTAFALCAIYLINPINLSNFRYKQVNTLSVMFLTLSVYLFTIRKEARSAIAFSLSYVFKLINAYLLPVFLIRSRERLRMLLLSVIVPLAGTAAYLLSSDFGFFRNILFGSGITQAREWSLSFSGLSVLLGLDPGLVSTVFLAMTLVFILAAYLVFRKEDLASFIFIVLSVYFFFANFIGPQHIILLYAALIMNWKWSGFIRRVAPLYFILPLLYFFTTAQGFGTRFLSAFGVAGLPFTGIAIANIILFKAVVFLGMVPYIRKVSPAGVYSDICHQLGRIRRIPWSSPSR